MTRTRTAWIALAMLALPLLADCTSRTIPLPPPEIDEVVGRNQQGLVLIRGRCQEGASVGVINEATQAGVIVTSAETNCGSNCPFEARIAAEEGDHLRVWQFFDTGVSRDLQVR
jgi:hypothetical protein